MEKSKREGDLIVFDIAHRIGDCLKIGEDLQFHISNLTGLGEGERRRFARKEEKKSKQRSLWNEQLLLLDRLVCTLFINGKEIHVKLDGEGWKKVAEITERLNKLNREMMR